MSLVGQVAKLSVEQATELHNTLLESGIAREAGNKKWREIFRFAKNRHIGLQGRIYEKLYQATDSQIEAMIRRITEKKFEDFI